MGFEMEKLGADTVRSLSAEAIQRAKSGHPGMPLGCADLAFALFNNHLRHDPSNPTWLGRDRFVLSAGHGSMLLYSLLHLFDYGLSMEDLKNFRQWGSLTPGHPEYGHTKGVEVTTGPLGSGFASAVGMAMALKQLATDTGLDRSGMFDPKVYVISGDGCMMEGSVSEAASLAGHQELDNLVCFYDDNKITIEGATSLAFSEDVPKRFEAFGWRVLICDDANDVAKVDAVIAEAKRAEGCPTLVVCKTQIGFGAPNKQGKSSAHGEPLGEDEVAAMKRNLGFDFEPFTVPEKLQQALAVKIAELKQAAADWNSKLDAFLAANADVKEKLDARLEKRVPADIAERLLEAAPTDKPIATRASGGVVLQEASKLVPALCGGAADLAPSTKTLVGDAGHFGPDDRSGRNFHFGVRELAMGLCGNGMALVEGTLPYTSTFFVFSDYMKPAIRLAALQKLHEIYVFTHDSFFVGEDGPTHEPIEQLAMLRSIPEMTVIRPCDANEVALAWAEALTAGGPVALVLTRQNLPPIPENLRGRIALSKGAYILKDTDSPDAILIATGSEVALAMEAAVVLDKDGVSAKIVSMPSWELFEKQSRDYRESVIPSTTEALKVSIEAASTFGWAKYTGPNGLNIGMEGFGASAPYAKLAEEYGFTAEAVAERIKNALA